MPADTFLIVNADDFGWTEGINDGIIEAHRSGILTSATLLANARATVHATHLARSNPSLSVGVHLSYNLGEPLLEWSELNTLYERDGRPRFSLPSLWLNAMLRPKVRRQLERHFRSQIEQVARLGIEITHLDTHKHVHFWPSVFEIVARLAAEYKIPAVRLVREDPMDFGPTAAKTRTVLAFLYWTSLVNLYKVARYNLHCPDRFVGIIQPGHWTRHSFMDVARALKPGVTEIMTHPGHPDGLENEPTRLVESRRDELKMLTHPVVKEFFLQCQLKVKLIGYRELPCLG